MKRTTLSVFLAYSLFALLSSPADAVDPDFTEDFSAGTANWATGGFTVPIAAPSGGPDGSSFISYAADFASIGQGTLFRAHAGFNSSNGAFVGNWINNHWITLSAFVRHNAPVAAEFIARAATAGNFPGAGIENLVSVPPNTWTEISFDVRPNNPLLTMEGPFPYASVFANVGNIQLGVSVPPGYASDTTDYIFDLDKVSVATPEPTSGLLLLFGVMTATSVRRHAAMMER